MQRRARHALLALCLVSCVPDLDSDEATIRTPRLLAVQAEPAEAGPNQPVRYRALVADAQGTRTDAALTWFHCLAQKPLAELGPVSPACLRADSGQLQPIGQGPTVQANLPREACSLFGPNPPPPVADQPPGRPVDPDESGGYKLPVVVGVNAGAGDAVVLYEQRIACGLAGVTPAVSVDYALRYHANTNPEVGMLRALRAGGEQVLREGEPLEVARDESITLEVGWPDCPASDVCGDGICGPDETRVSCAEDCGTARGCGGQERFVVYDRANDRLDVARESLRVAWYATAGRYDEERTGAAADASSSASKNAWQAPATPGQVTLWLVLRDARGGVGFREQPVIVR